MIKPSEHFWKDWCEYNNSQDALDMAEMSEPKSDQPSPELIAARQRFAEARLNLAVCAGMHGRTIWEALKQYEKAKESDVTP